MGVEIERKYLVAGDGWKSVSPVILSQGYLNTDKARTVRVRTTGSDAFLTIKGITSSISRPEYEYAIPIDDARELLALCSDSIIQKNRYVLPIGDVVWEIDEFLGDNEGLIIAEAELISETQIIELPEWIGKEVSGETRYYNSSLASMPFKHWTD